MPATVSERMRDPALDGRLLEACQQGDREALRALFEAYKDRVFSLALRFTGEEAAAKDVVQEVFLKLFSRIGQFRREAHFGTWLFRLVANACIDERRRRRRFLPLTAASVAQPVAALGPQERGLERQQERAAVHRAVSQLSPKLRLPILLRYLEDLSYEEIAAVLGCTKGTVASRLNRGHRELARRLRSPRGPGEPR
jgi:RNA polymerase sigma-70 factor (ECF subfamily)